MRRLAIAIVVAAGTAHAQSITSGAVEGTVKDATGTPLAGVMIIIGNQSDFSDGDGHYKITELLPGTYDVRFEYNKSKVLHSGVVVSANTLTHLDQEVKAGEEIHVHGTPPPIDLIDTAKKYKVGRPEIENVPHPGPTFESVIGGAGGTQNDGVGVAFSGSTSL